MKIILLFTLQLYSSTFLTLLKENNTGKAKFITNEKEEGELEWSIKDNTWKFHYQSVSFIIKNKTLLKVEKSKTTSYPCFGVAKILEIPFELWKEALILHKEIINENMGWSIFKFQNSYITFNYQIKPFKIIAINYSQGEISFILNFI